MNEELETQTSGQTSPNGKKKLNRTQLILIIGILVILVVGAVLGYLILQGNRGEGPAGTSNLVIDESSKDVNLADKVQEGMYAVKMNANWQFPDGKSASPDAYVANSEHNKRDVYFEVSLQETEEIVYTSPVIPVGSAIQGFSLDKDLKAGEYPAYCTYHLLDKEGNTTSSLSVEIDITVLQ